VTCSRRLGLQQSRPRLDRLPAVLLEEFRDQPPAERPVRARHPPTQLRQAHRLVRLDTHAPDATSPSAPRPVPYQPRPPCPPGAGSGGGTPGRPADRSPASRCRFAASAPRSTPSWVTPPSRCRSVSSADRSDCLTYSLKG